MEQTYYQKNRAYRLSKATEYYEKNKEARLAYQKQYQVARKAAGWKQPSRARPGTPRKPRPSTKKINTGTTYKERKLKKPKLYPEPKKSKYDFAEASFELSFA
jgi:hypothetical protein